MKNIIIRGYYGRDNLGDELMKGIFIENFNKSSNLQIMNSDPDGLFAEYGINTPPELVTGKTPSFKNAISRFMTIMKSDLFVFGGGTILTDKHGYFHLAENAVYFVLRRVIGKKSLLISVGATKFKSNIGKILSKVLVYSSNGTLVRDYDSYMLLKKITSNSKKLVLSSDMVLLTTKQFDFNLAIESKTIGICIMPYNWATFHKNGNDADLLRRFAEQIVLIGHKTGYKFIIIPIQYGTNSTTDYEYSKQLYNIIKDKVDVEFCERKGIENKIYELGRCEYLISMRLHALMISALTGGKVFAINHNEKIAYFMKRYADIKHSVTLSEMQLISEKFLNMMTDTNSIKQYALSADYKRACFNISIINKYITK